MAMSINKVFVSGRVSGQPYEVPARHRPFTRFHLLLPVERSRKRPEPDKVLVEAVGRNAELVAQLLKDGALITLEGRLRTTLLSQGENRIETLLIRLENFSINQQVAEEEVTTPSGSQRKRSGRRRGKGERQSAEKQSATNEQGAEKKESSPETSAALDSKAAPEGESAAQETPGDGQASSPSESEATKAPEAPAQTAPASEAAKPAEAPAAPAPAEASEPQIPDIKPVADASLKEDMPF